MPTPRNGYFLKDGTQVPSVTTILKVMETGSSDALCHWAAKLARGGESWLDVRDRAAKLGTWIHDALERYPDPLPTSAPPWMTANDWEKAQRDYSGFAEWDARVQPRVVAHEVQLVSERLRAGGTFDLVLDLPGCGDPDGSLCVTDHKTGKVVDPVKVPVQLAAYAEMALECGLVDRPIRRGLVLHYTPRGLKPIEITAAQLDAGLAIFTLTRELYAQIKGFPK